MRQGGAQQPNIPEFHMVTLSKLGHRSIVIRHRRSMQATENSDTRNVTLYQTRDHGWRPARFPRRNRGWLADIHRRFWR